MRKPWERQVPQPVGQSCLYCQEAIVDGDAGTIDQSGQIIHYECQMRMAIGSIAHQERSCLCFGGTASEDPAHMTPRQAAVAAYHYWRHHHTLVLQP
jgi:hypothetical protein